MHRTETAISYRMRKFEKKICKKNYMIERVRYVNAGETNEKKETRIAINGQLQHHGQVQQKNVSQDQC
jgi:hypothetical protein